MYAPIPYHKQAGHFGVYVSPKMNTHMFIGPFSMSAGCDGDEMLATKMGTALEECARATVSTRAALFKKLMGERVPTQKQAPEGMTGEGQDAAGRLVKPGTIDQESTLCHANDFVKSASNVIHAANPWSTPSVGKHLHVEDPPLEGTLGGGQDSTGTPPPPPRHLYENGFDTSIRKYVGDAAAKQWAAPRQLPQPSQLPESTHSEQTVQKARAPPVQGGLQLQLQ